jgi:hypothetical protein
MEDERETNSRPATSRPATQTDISPEELDLFAQKIQVRSATTRIPVYQGNNREFCGNWILYGLLAASKDAHVTGVWPKFPVKAKPGMF